MADVGPQDPGDRCEDLRVHEGGRFAAPGGLRLRALRELVRPGLRRVGQGGRRRRRPVGRRGEPDRGPGRAERRGDDPGLLHVLLGRVHREQRERVGRRADRLPPRRVRPRRLHLREPERRLGADVHTRAGDPASRARHRDRDRVHQRRPRRLGQDHVRHRPSERTARPRSAGTRCVRTSVSRTTGCGSTRTAASPARSGPSTTASAARPGCPPRARSRSRAASGRSSRTGRSTTRVRPARISCEVWSWAAICPRAARRVTSGSRPPTSAGSRTGTSGRASRAASSSATPTTRAAPSPSPAAATSGTAGRAARAAPPARPTSPGRRR